MQTHLQGGGINDGESSSIRLDSERFFGANNASDGGNRSEILAFDEHQAKRKSDLTEMTEDPPKTMHK